MWLLHLLPIGLIAIIVHGILLLGIVGLAASYLIRLFPIGELYSLSIRIASMVILIVSVYLEGVYNTHVWYQDQVKELQAAIAQSEAQSKTLNNELSSEIKKDTLTIQNHTETVRTEVREKLVPIDKDCKLDPMVVSVLNHGAQSPLKTESTPENESTVSKGNQ